MKGGNVKWSVGQSTNLQKCPQIFFFCQNIEIVDLFYAVSIQSTDFVTFPDISTRFTCNFCNANTNPVIN